ncbi:Hypothetical predicted protein [Paramuricea clavata]|uniref:LicD/FKTN/FKRP nucleotidyltransferase domain-containing protein n=1 Tax=Paramuricea clavata TaxID=317549 RepID=A0A7D9I0W2_PARCT|nr:Hypothetical predicted protein [Paramuricea clavata]
MPIQTRGNTAIISKLNVYLRICLLGAAAILLMYLFMSGEYLKQTLNPDTKESQITKDAKFYTEVEDDINPDKPTQPYTAYGEGCRENPYRERFKTLLKSWEGIAARQNITDYFICFGSMLGQVRNGDCVPYDHDIDICMFRRDLYKLESEEEKRPFKYDDGNPHMIIQRHCHHPPGNTPRQDCKGNVVTSYTDKCAIVDPCARILLGSPPFLDVFAIKDKGNELFDEYKRVAHKREVILPLRPCKYMGIDTKCLNNQTTYLTRYYGKDYYKPIYVCKGGKWVRPS